MVRVRVKKAESIFPPKDRAYPGEGLSKNDLLIALGLPPIHQLLKGFQSASVVKQTSTPEFSKTHGTAITLITLDGPNIPEITIYIYIYIGCYFAVLKLHGNFVLKYYKINKPLSSSSSTTSSSSLSSSKPSAVDNKDNNPKHRGGGSLASAGGERDRRKRSKTPPRTRGGTGGIGEYNSNKSLQGNGSGSSGGASLLKNRTSVSFIKSKIILNPNNPNKPNQPPSNNPNKPETSSASSSASNPSNPNNTYQRLTEGSDGHLSSTNRGYAMLSRMGWNKGQGLGVYTLAPLITGLSSRVITDGT